MKSIVFKTPWRGRQPGEKNSDLDYGVMVELVRRKIADWIEDEPKGRKANARTAGTGNAAG